MSWIYSNPVDIGKYIVTVLNSRDGHETFVSYWDGNNWNFTNKTFIKYKYL